jgi:hypothetical protein
MLREKQDEDDTEGWINLRYETVVLFRQKRKGYSIIQTTASGADDLLHL